MKNIFFILIIFGLFLGETFGQNRPPRFQDYAVSTRFKGKAAKINFRTDPHGRKFRTMLRYGLKDGAQFAGHYAISKWRCGSMCLRVGIINLKTGHVYITPFYIGHGAVSFKLNSRLFIVSPPEETKKDFGDNVPDHALPRYYVWRNNRLVLVHPKDGTQSDGERFWL